MSDDSGHTPFAGRRRHKNGVRFWEQNGSGGTLSGTVRRSHRAQLDMSDVQERRIAVALPGVRSVRIEGVRGSNPLSSTEFIQVTDLSVTLLPVGHSLDVRFWELVGSGSWSGPACKRPGERLALARLKARGARRAPMARPLRARARPGKKPDESTGFARRAGAMRPQQAAAVVRPLRLSTSGARRAASRLPPRAAARATPRRQIPPGAPRWKGPSSRRHDPKACQDHRRGRRLRRRHT